MKLEGSDLLRAISFAIKKDRELVMEFEGLLQLALVTRAEVAKELASLVLEKDQATRQQILETVETYEGKFLDEKGTFLNELFLRGIDLGDKFSYHDLCNSVVA